MKGFIRFAGYSNVLFALAFFLYWVFYGSILPIRDPVSMVPIISNINWVWLNSLVILSTIAGIVGLTGIFILQVPSGKTPGIVGFVLSLMGLVILAGQIFGEAFIWKIIVLNQPDFLSFDGPLYTNTMLTGIMITGGIFFGGGYLTLGAVSRRVECLPSWGLQLVIIGAPLFGLAPLFDPVQHTIKLAGVTIFAVGLILSGIKMIRFHSVEQT